jgi:hypothetical protein
VTSNHCGICWDAQFFSHVTVMVWQADHMWNQWERRSILII